MMIPRPIWLRCVVALALTVCSLTGGHSVASAQVEVSGRATEDLNQSFFMDAISFAGTVPQKSRLDVFVQVGYDNLSFTKQDDRYFASFDLTVTIYDSSNSLVNEKLWTEELKGLSFDESIAAGAYRLTQRVFTVDPGKYLISVAMRDNESKVTRRLVRQLLVSDFSQPSFSLSDIMLISRIALRGDKRSITPSVSPNVGNVPEAFYVYFEVYNRQKVDSIELVATVLSEKGEKKSETDTTALVSAGRNEQFMRIPHVTLPLGDYRLFIEAYPLHWRDSLHANSFGVTNRSFVVRWQGLPKGVKDLDVAIDQLRYIAKESELSELKEAKTPEEKQAKFMAFWKKRNPNPNTPRNPKMEEYYARVEYSNKHFTHYMEGWRTDMGMVYIIFGAPNDVSRHPFEIDSKPYEVWRYYDLNYDFVFVDQTGFGDYRLATPLWEVWQRPPRD